MKKMIKVTTIHDEVLFLNIDYIIEMKEASKGAKENTIITLNNIDKIKTLLVNETMEELGDISI